jgi:uncharacterized RDD family membrane protein YckC
MSWKCTSCGLNDNSDAAIRCVCGYELVIETDDENSSQNNLATSNQRLSNMLLDTLFFTAFCGILGIVLGLIGISDYIQNINRHVFSLILFLGYYVPQEAFTGRTLGKIVTKTKVICSDGRKLTFGKAVGRTFCRLIPFEWFSFTGNVRGPIGWHDRIPKTIVISLKDSGTSSVGKKPLHQSENIDTARSAEDTHQEWF